MNELVKKTALVTTTALFVILFFYVFYQSSVLFLSALIGIGVSALITPFLNYLNEKYKIPRFLGAIALFFIITGFFTIFFLFMGSIVVEQFDALKENLPSIIEDWKDKWLAISAKYPTLGEVLESQSSSSDLPGVFLSYVSVVFKNLVSSATGITLATVIAIFTAVNAKKYHSTFMDILPEELEEKAKKRIQLSQDVLHSWFGAQLIDIVIVAVLTSFSLWLAGIKYWAVFGLLTGFSVMIPYAGILVATAISACIVMVVQPEKLFVLLVIYGITQQIEGSIILPLLLKDRVKIPAAPLIFLMALAGSWFGVLGVLITPPLFAIILAQYRMSEG